MYDHRYGVVKDLKDEQQLRAADEAEGVEPHKGTWRVAPAGRAGTRSTAANLNGDLPQNQADEEVQRAASNST
ncbi:hypothetical protein [Streptomyces sp. NPDC059970]|uniref:hypothetical protein n=1 Tax=Streptomyces sp. NPDC059970 TaxID=3347019 RepID=UPI00367A954B